MTGAPNHDAPSPSEQVGREQLRYPANHVLAVLDTRQAADESVAALTSGGFMESEIQVGTGAELGDQLDSTTGRRGLAHVLIRFAEWIGATNEEMETKNRYEQAMRENRFVISVAAPTAERKQQAAQILRQQGGHTVSFLGTRTIEHLVPPR